MTNKPEKYKVVKVLDNDTFILQGENGATRQATRPQIEKALESGSIELLTLKCKCLDKERDKHGNITDYLLVDRSGNKRQMDAKKLKQLIRNYQLDVVDLTLTKDNRLVDGAEKKSAPKKKAPMQKQVQPTAKAPEVKKPAQINIVPVVLTHEVVKCLLDLLENAMYDDKKLVNIRIAFIGKHSSTDLSKAVGTAKSLGDTPFSYVEHITEKGFNLLVFPKNLKESNFKMPSNCKGLFEGFSVARMMKNSGYIENKDGYGYSMDEAVHEVASVTMVFDGLDWTDVETTECMFMYAQIAKISIINSTAPKLKNAFGMFKDSVLKSAQLDGLKAPVIERTTAMFMNCSRLNQYQVYLHGLNFGTVKFVGKMFYVKDNDKRINRTVYPADKLVAQCIELGWKGYEDGRPDDFTTPLSDNPNKESNGYSRTNKPRKTDDKDKFFAPCFIDARILEKLKEAYGLMAEGNK